MLPENEKPGDIKLLEEEKLEADWIGDERLDAGDIDSGAPETHDVNDEVVDTTPVVFNAPQTPLFVNASPEIAFQIARPTWAARNPRDIETASRDFTSLNTCVETLLVRHAHISGVVIRCALHGVKCTIPRRIQFPIIFRARQYRSRRRYSPSGDRRSHRRARQGHIRKNLRTPDIPVLVGIADFTFEVAVAGRGTARVLDKLASRRVIAGLHAALETLGIFDTELV